MRSLIERLPSSVEGRLVERRHKHLVLLPWQRSHVVDARVRGSYLLIDSAAASEHAPRGALAAAAAGKKAVNADLPQESSSHGVKPQQEAQEHTTTKAKATDDGEALRANAVDLTARARVVNLEGAVVADVSTSKGKKKRHAFRVAFMNEKRKVHHIELECESQEQVQMWVRAIERASHRAAPRKDDFEPLLLLGSGHFGKVTLVAHKPTGTVLALKEMREEQVAAARMEAARIREQKKRSSKKKKFNWNAKGIGQLKLEKQITERLLLGELVDDRWVARLAFAFRERGKLMLAQEFAARGDLWSLIRSQKRLSIGAATQISSELVSAVGSLHARGILHRDIKLENIMLDTDGHIKLIDLGLSKQLSIRPVIRDDRKRYGFTFSLCGTRYYMSPEQIKGTGHNLSTDWWQVGCLIYELVVGKPAFFDKNTAKIDERILSGEGPNMLAFRKFAGESHQTELACKLIQSLLVHDTSDRLGAAGADEVRKHPFFQELSWSKVDARQGAVDKDIASYVDSGKPGHIVDSEVVAKYFRDAKTLDGEKLNDNLAISLKLSSSASSGSLASADTPEVDRNRFMVGGTRNGSTASAATAQSDKRHSSDSVSTLATSSNNTYSGRHAKPTLPRRTESRGPLLGFSFAAPIDTLMDMSQGLVSS
ncbi:Protein kinase, putative [Hondaea fermentalgiana]|uniref:Protein kinase, putative n=1 Tax=Hondaea fermentalgiana TaxID=2315210 RepID=A0A2R5G1T0_9STRA|nr:Protein kinase, putative [Hondaea fermentalgiana]|eukprot:GBG24269.1 Protein kinase, putative [Hondaea fermentalgiana]